MKKLFSELKQRYEVTNARLAKYWTFTFSILLIITAIYVLLAFLSLINIRFELLEPIAAILFVLICLTLMILVIIESLEDFLE